MISGSVYTLSSFKLLGYGSNAAHRITEFIYAHREAAFNAYWKLELFQVIGCQLSD